MSDRRTARGSTPRPAGVPTAARASARRTAAVRVPATRTAVPGTKIGTAVPGTKTRTAVPGAGAGAARVSPAGPRLVARAAAARVVRRRQWLRRGGLAALGLLPLASLGWLLWGSSVLALRVVVVTGESRLSAAQVQAAVNVANGTPLAQVDTAAVAARVRRLGPIGSVRVTRRWPHELRVAVVERVAVAAVADGPGVVLLDEQGVVIGPAATLPRGLLPVHAPAAGSPEARAALSVVRTLPSELRSMLAAVDAPAPEEVTLLLRGGRRVLWGSAGPAGQEARKAQAVLALVRLPGRFLDVSAPGIATRR